MQPVDIIKKQKRFSPPAGTISRQQLNLKMQQENALESSQQEHHKHAFGKIFKSIIKKAVLIIAATLLLGGLVLIGEFGQLALVILALPAYIKKIDSRLGFGLALLALGYMAILQMIGFVGLAQRMAVLAYICLALSVIAFGLEMSRKKKLGFTRH